MPSDPAVLVACPDPAVACADTGREEPAMAKPAKNTICLWYDGDAEDAARFYAETFPDSSVGAVTRAPADNPSSPDGPVLTGDFTTLGIPTIGLISVPT